MKIDVGSIAGYAEMTAEQKLAALESFEYEDNAAELEKARNALSKANSEAADWKRKHNALLGEDERKKAADEEERNAEKQKYADLEAKFNELTRKSTISEYTAKFLTQGYDEKLAHDTAEALFEGDMAKVFANAESFKKDFEAKIKADLLQNTPKPEGGSGESSNPYADRAKDIGKAKAEANKTATDVMKHYLKT